MLEEQQGNLRLQPIRLGSIEPARHRRRPDFPALRSRAHLALPSPDS